jgi:ribonuclease P protein component
MPEVKPFSLPKSERLRSLASLRRLFNEGKSGFIFPFRYTLFAESSTSPSVEVLFSVPKRNHKRANKRNLLRRRSKEAYRLNKFSLHEAVEAKGLDLDIALVYSTKEELSYKTIENAVRRILAEVQERC